MDSRQAAGGPAAARTSHGPVSCYGGVGGRRMSEGHTYTAKRDWWPSCRPFGNHASHENRWSSLHWSATTSENRLCAGTSLKKLEQCYADTIAANGPVPKDASLHIESREGRIGSLGPAVSCINNILADRQKKRNSRRVLDRRIADLPEVSGPGFNAMRFDADTRGASQHAIGVQREQRIPRGIDVIRGRLAGDGLGLRPGGSQENRGQEQ